MYYLIYQITNKINGKIYIGKHRTQDKNDDYMGSGVLIKRAEEKYGLENFEKTILFECASEEEMNAKEAEIVNEEFLKRPDVYNIMLGGNGGFSHLNSCAASKGGKMVQAKHANDVETPWHHAQRNRTPERKRELSLAASARYKEYYKTHNGTFTGRHHTKETKEKMSILRMGMATGEKNPNYGKHWYHNPETGESHLFKPEDVPNGWVIGRNFFSNKDEKLRAEQKIIREERNRIKAEHRAQLNLEHSIYLKQLQEMYEVYIQGGFRLVKELFNYPYSSQNLVAAFRRYIPEFEANKHPGRHSNRV